MTDRIEDKGEGQAAVPRRNWAACARRPVQWTETYAIDGDPKRGVMLTALYMADRLAIDAEVTLEATLLVRGEARASVTVPVTGVPGWRWARLFTWADQMLMGIEAEERAQAAEQVCQAGQARVAALVRGAMAEALPKPAKQRKAKDSKQAKGAKKVQDNKTMKLKRVRKAPKELG